jgi:hypothetical protein
MREKALSVRRQQIAILHLATGTKFAKHNSVRATIYIFFVPHNRSDAAGKKSNTRKEWSS